MFEASSSSSGVKGKAQENEITSNFGVTVMVAKGIFGLGIFTIPHLTKYVGYIGVSVMYPTLSIILTLMTCLAVYTANKIGYQGRR